MSKAYVQRDTAVTGKYYVETEGGGDTPAGGGADYSFEEHKVGKWYDGSDIYECTYSTEWSIAAGTSGAQNRSLQVNAPNIKDLIWYEIIPISLNSLNSAVQGNAPRALAFSLTVTGDITVSAGVVSFLTVTANANLTWTGFTDVIVRIRYTKTE